MLNTNKADVSHNHDDRYYTEAEINGKLLVDGYYVRTPSTYGVIGDALYNAHPGLLYAINASTRNTPYANFYGLMLVLAPDPTWRFHILINTACTDLYINGYINGAWVGWHQVKLSKS